MCNAVIAILISLLTIGVVIFFVIRENIFVIRENIRLKKLQKKYRDQYESGLRNTFIAAGLSEKEANEKTASIMKYYDGEVTEQSDY